MFSGTGHTGDYQIDKMPSTFVLPLDKGEPKSEAILEAKLMLEPISELSEAATSDRSDQGDAWRPSKLFPSLTVLDPICWFDTARFSKSSIDFSLFSSSSTCLSLG